MKVNGSVEILTERKKKILVSIPWVSVVMQESQWQVHNVLGAGVKYGVFYGPALLWRMCNMYFCLFLVPPTPPPEMAI